MFPSYISATTFLDASRSTAGTHLNPVFSDDNSENDANEQQRAKRKNQREQQQLAMFLAIKGGAKDTVYNHYVHTSQCPQRKGTGTAKCAGSSKPSQDFISRTLGEILLNALKERGVFKDDADQQGSLDDDEIDEDLFPDNEKDGTEDEDDEGEHDDVIDDEEDDIEDEELTNNDNEVTGIEDSLVDETADIDHDKDQHPDDQSINGEEHDAEPENIPPSSVSIDKIREIMRNAFGIECNCSVIPKVDTTNQTIAKPTDTEGEHGDHDDNTVNDPNPIDEPAKTTLCEHVNTTTTTTPAPVVKPCQKPNRPPHSNHPVSTLNEQMVRAIADAAAKLSSIGTSMQVVGRRSNAKSQSVENTVNIQVNSSKAQRRTDTAPTRVQLNTGDLPDLSHDTPAPIKTTARSVRKSSKVATHPKAEDLQFFRDQRDRSARRAHKRQPPQHRQRQATGAAHGARRVRNEQPAASALADQSAALDPANVSALSNVADIASAPALVNVQRRERGAVVRRARRPEKRPDDRSSGDRAATANHSARASLSAGVKGAASRPVDDSADVLLKRFLGLYERYKRSQDEDAYDDFDDASDADDDVTDDDEVNESD